MALRHLDANHYRAIELLIEGKLTQKQIAEAVGVHPNTIGNWKKDPLFEQAYKEAVVRSSHDRLPELVNAMMDTAIKDGNAAMAKLVLQMNDMLTSKIEVDQKQASKEQINFHSLDAELKAFGDSFEH